MLTGILLALSAVAAALLCVATGSFSTLHWLWLLPASFVGSFLVLLALGFAVFVLICALIDPEKPRDKDTPWFRWLIMEIVQLILTVLPIRVEATGTEKLPKNGRFVLVCNHLDNIDPAFIYYCFPKSQLAFVGKRETSQMPLVNKVMPKLLCPTINRENGREALKTILRCISLLKADTVSIAVFPEGRINPYRKLAHFRPGVFKIAQKANVPVVVCTLQGTNHVIPRLLKGKGSTVRLHLLDVIPAQALEDRTTVDIAEQIYAMMAADLGPENVLTPEEEENT
jgi:1-acyl-sn-glycerol-3-phosphate acyltransferase